METKKSVYVFQKPIVYKKIVRCPFQSRSNRTKAKKASNSYKTIPFQ